MGVSSADNLAQNNPVAGRLRISVAALRRSEFATFDTKQAPKTVKMGCLLVKWGIQVSKSPFYSLGPPIGLP